MGRRRAGGVWRYFDFLQKIHKSHFSFLSVSCAVMSPAAHCPKYSVHQVQVPSSRFGRFMSSSASPLLPPGHLLAFHFTLLCFLGWFFLATEGKEEEGKKENNPSRVPQGKPGDRSSVLYSAGQFFFEYLVVVSLKKMSDGRYEPKITYQFPKVFSPVFLGR